MHLFVSLRHLVALDMANEIGGFFEAMPERGAALEGIAGHIKRFWDPRMGRELLAHVDAGGGSELSKVVAEALSRQRGRLG
jgi:formate dehydrogenase subunit delta